MANYVFLMELYNKTLTETEQSAMIKLTVTGCGFSFVGTMLTLCLLCFLPVGSDGMFILSNMSVSLLAAQIAFIGAENSNPNGMVCKSSTAIIHYLFLCLQFASLRYALHLVGKLKPHNLIDKSQKKFTIVIFVWGLPFLIVAITAVLRGDTYGKDEMCWLSTEHGTRWAFLGPLVVIQIINWIVFVMMLLTRMIVDLKRHGTFVSAAKKQLLTACSLIPVLGLTWSMGFSITTGRFIVIQYLFVFFTSTQGLLILIGHVLPNNHVRKALCSKITPGDHEHSAEYSENTTDTSGLFDPIEKEKDINAKRGSVDNDRKCRHEAVRNEKLGLPTNSDCRRRSAYN